MKAPDKIYHLCFPENKVPNTFHYHNKILESIGALVSLKFRKGPLNNSENYLVFWIEEGQVYFSRINPILYGLDAFFFKDGKEMVECRSWEELTDKIKELNEKGYCELED